MLFVFFVLLAATVAACGKGGPDLAPATVEGLDDDFSGDELSPSWQVLNGDTCALTVEGGALHLRPNRNVVWYHAAQGPLVYKLVTGNFRVSTAVRARKASDPSQPVGNGFQFGGIMARDPASDGPTAKESYVFSVLGYRGDYLSAETKTTRGDVSYVAGPAWPSGDGELRICRINGRFHLYNRPIGGAAWKHAITYKRPDLPATLQVGPIAYTFTDEFDLRASFDEIDFAPVAGKDDCTRD